MCRGAWRDIYRGRVHRVPDPVVRSARHARSEEEAQEFRLVSSRATDHARHMAPKRRYKQRVAKNDGRLRGGAKFDFMRAIAKKAALPAGSVQKLLAALKVMAIDQLKETGYCCIGGICRLRVKTKPAQKARTMICWGKKIRLKARDRPVKKISCVMLRPLSHALE